MAERLIGSSDHSCGWVSGGLPVALLVLPCLFLTCLFLPATVARAGGVGDGALRVTVTVNGRGDSGVRPPDLRVGRPAVKRYRLVNRSEAHLYGVRVTDPGVPRGTVVRCPGRPLPALGELECVARFQAAPGLRRGTVRATGSVPSLGRMLTATARTAYSGVAGDLRLTEQVTVGPARRSAAPGLRSLAVTYPAALTYTVTNHGNRPLHAVRVEDPALGLRAGSVDCAGRPGTVPLLAPGASARCTAAVRRAPGTHRSTGLASGSDRVTTYGPGGGRVPAPTLVARSAAAFTVRVNTAVAEAPTAAAGNPAGSGRGSGVAGRPPGAAGTPGAAGAPGASGRPAAPAAAAGGAGAALGAGGVPGVAPPPAPGSGVPVPGAAGAAALDAAAVPPAGVSAPAPPLPTAATAGTTGTAEPLASDAGAGNPDAPAARRAALLDTEGFLGRLRRRGREASEFGVVAMLLLILIPAAVAAALLGNRRS
ncbi:DUF7507 domain-containing protein [Streptomyces sp. NBC_00691]|uniref:DUF7507 domain-containing protein n=1 Tax=Streptomyces sp. NBC_00691 TaxID=2903671 RepID=UPI002E376E70|nr:hypothetical protein [Streptomyces sp. NBC_00691]